MAIFSVKVPKEYNKQERLDKYIASLPNGMNRSKLKSGVCEILINGKKSKLSQKIKPNDQIDIQWEDNIPDNIIEIPIIILPIPNCHKTSPFRDLKAAFSLME